MKKILLVVLLFTVSITATFASGALFHFDIGFASAKKDHNGKDIDFDSIAWGVGMTSNTASADEHKRFNVGFGASCYVSTNVIPDNVEDKSKKFFIDGTIMTGPGFVSAPWKGGGLGLTAGPAFALSLGHQFCTLGFGIDSYMSQQLGESGISMAIGVYGVWLPISIFSQYNDGNRIAVAAYFGLAI